MVLTVDRLSSSATVAGTALVVSVGQATGQIELIAYYL